MAIAARHPFLIVEVGKTQTRPALEKKVWYWLQGSKQHVKIVCVFDLVQTSMGYKVFADIVKPNAIPDPASGDPHMFRVEGDYVIRKAEVYPNLTDLSFDIYLSEVLPKDWENDPATAAEYCTFNLGMFFVRAQQAALQANNQAQEVADGRSSSPFYEHQTALPSPTRSIQGEPDKQSISGSNKVEDDGEYEYETDSSDGDEPSFTKRG
ncbi:MAG: hypothetical protein L6R39_001042 [Caloplaca ligustica]|nr:MAG: hypothetical protein L6R39_001042 [Caloplaca ligustica]